MKNDAIRFNSWSAGDRSISVYDLKNKQTKKNTQIQLQNHWANIPAWKVINRWQDQRAPVRQCEKRETDAVGTNRHQLAIGDRVCSAWVTLPFWADGWDDSSTFSGPNLHGLSSHLGSTPLPSWGGQYQPRSGMHTWEQGFREDAAEAPHGMVPLAVRGPRKQDANTVRGESPRGGGDQLRLDQTGSACAGKSDWGLGRVLALGEPAWDRDLATSRQAVSRVPTVWESPRGEVRVAWAGPPFSQGSHWDPGPHQATQPAWGSGRNSPQPSLTGSDFRMYK